MAEPGAGNEQHDECDSSNRQRGAQIRLHRHSQNCRADENQLGQQAIDKILRVNIGFDEIAGQVENQGEFGQLRRLKLNRAEHDPAPRAANHPTLRREQEQEQHHEAEPVNRRCIAQDAVIIDAHDGEHDRQSDGDAKQLAFEKERAILMKALSPGRAGGINKANAKEQQHQNGGQQSQIDAD
jgi:hypothetical protein